uniref:Uncharacterized protein n=1 Tax=Anguilla anguilla TaxID=7936 RepID=A0A0E9S084_ANGAN
MVQKAVPSVLFYLIKVFILPPDCCKGTGLKVMFLKKRRFKPLHFSYSLT